MARKITCVRDISRHFDVSVEAVHKWVRENKIPANDMLAGKNMKLWSFDIISEIEKLREEGK